MTKVMNNDVPHELVVGNARHVHERLQQVN